MKFTDYQLALIVADLFDPRMERAITLARQNLRHYSDSTLIWVVSDPSGWDNVFRWLALKELERRG